MIDCTSEAAAAGTGESYDPSMSALDARGL